MLRLLMAGLVMACLAWGALTAWTVSQHTSAARDAVTVREPLSLDAQQMYQSLSDADVTASTAFLSGPQEPLPARQRYQADIANAAADLARSKAAQQAWPISSWLASLAAISAGLPVYTGYVAEAQTDYSLGYMLTGGSFMQVASEEMQLTLLPAAHSIYAQENAQLAAASAAATGLPWIAVAMLLALSSATPCTGRSGGCVRRTHRVLNYGLLAASVVLIACLVWLVAAVRGGAGGSAARGRARLRPRGNARPGEHRRGARPRRRGPQPDLAQRRRTVRAGFPGRARPAGTGTGHAADHRRQRILAGAPAPSGRSAAEHDARAWYAVNEQAYRLDAQARYTAETQLVIGSRAGQLGSRIPPGRDRPDPAIDADQVIFHGSGTAGSGRLRRAWTSVSLVAALLMAARLCLGAVRRLAEYR